VDVGNICRDDSDPPPAGDASVKSVYRVLAATAAVRLFVAAFTPLFPDETYYWEWSRRLALGYFDHPPLVAWLVRVGTLIFGDTPLGVRFGPVAAGVAGTFFIAAAARRLADDRAALIAAVVFAVMPLSAAGLVLATPDAGLLACVAAVLYCVVRALELPAGTRGSLTWWTLAGVAQGLSFWAKYTSVLIPVGLLIAMVARSDWRSRLREPGPYVAVVVASLVFAPVLVWNSQHEWISFRYQLEHGLTGSGGSILKRELELIGGQLGLVTPVLFAMMWIAVAKALTEKPSALSSARLPPSSFLLAAVALLTFAFFAYSTTKRRPEANWPAIAYLPAALVLVAHARTLRWDRWLKAGIVVSAVLTLMTYVNAFVPILPVPARRDPAARASGWDVLATAVQSQLTNHQSRVFIAGNRYQEASELAFHLPDHPQTLALNIEGRPNQYDLWPSFAQRAARGDSLLLVVDDVELMHPAVTALLEHFSGAERGAQVTLARNSDVVKTLRIWTLSGWRGTWPALRSRP
jgi:4-amino-4-deoxy-L-arabinose transferase-like glycosyltransferase